MTKQELLQKFQTHGDLAFAQGYAAASLKISKTDNGTLASMPEAQERLKTFLEIYQEILQIRLAE